MAVVSSANSVVELSSDVNSTIEKLLELRIELGLNKPSFSDEFSSDAPSIISSLKKLDRVRLKAHDKLETESITSSVLRHRLSVFTSCLKREAADAVNSARSANVTQLQQLKDKIESMNREAAELVKKHEVLDLHNERIQVEIQEAESRHQNKAGRLNERISERACLQIQLNETTHQLDTTNRKIHSLNQEMSELECTLTEERESFNTEKDHILKTLDMKKVKLNETNSENRQLKSELAELQDELVGVTFAVQQATQDITTTERDIADLSEEEKALKEIIIVTECENNTLTEANERVECDIATMEREFKQKHSQKQEQVQLLLKELEQCYKENSALQLSKKQTTKEYEEAESKRCQQSGSLGDLKNSIDLSKKLLTSESEASVRLAAEKKELEYRLLTLRETHKVTIQLLKEELTDLKDKLAKERRTRETVEDGYNLLQTTIQEHLTDHSHTMNTLNSQIGAAEAVEKKMIEKSEHLQVEISTYDQNITALRQELQLLTDSLNSISNDLEGKITSTEDLLADLTEEGIEHSDVLSTLVPSVAQLKDSYAILTDEYERRKKEMIALKNVKAGLEDTCTKLHRDLENMHIPQDKLRMETLSCRAYARQYLSQQNDTVRSIEDRVSEGEMKLNTIESQNSRFTRAMDELRVSELKLSSLHERSKYKEQAMINRMRSIKGSLLEHWEANKDCAQHYSRVDRVTVDELAMCETQWSDRATRLKSLSEQFDWEMSQFSQYLHRMANP